MKKLIFTFLIAGSVGFMLTSCSSDDPIPQNEPETDEEQVIEEEGISGDLTSIELQEGETYLVTGDLYVPEEGSVTIPAGVTFEFQEGSNGEAWFLDVHGSLYVMGEEDSRVVFTASDELINSSKNNGIGQLWGGITGTTTTGDLIIQYADVLYAGGTVRSSVAFAGAATDAELEAGDAGYALFYIRKAGERQDGVFILRHSHIAFTPDDAIRINGGKTLMEYNIFEVTGGTGGDAVNIKAGSYGDFAYNLFYNLATNGLKSADTGPGEQGRLETNFYNNTILNSGYRRAEAGRGAGLNYESNAYGKVYNNLLVNNRFGLRLVTGEDMPNIEALEYGYNWYYGSDEAVVEQFYPNLGSSIGMIGNDDRTPVPASDVTGEVGENDPLFVAYDPSTFVYSGEATDPLMEDISPIPDGADFHLQASSPALSGGYTDFEPVNATYTSLDGSLIFTAPTPSSFFGAFGTAND